MENLQKNNSFLQQKDRNTVKYKKHDANLKSNSTLFFQVGIIICLLITYALFEISFKTNEVVLHDYTELQDEDIYVYNMPIKIFEDVKQLEKRKKEPKVLNNPIIKNDDGSTIDSEVVIEPTTQEPTMDPSQVSVVEIPDYLAPFSILAVEQVPIFPGCEDATTNEERRQCMSDKIAAHVKKKFNINIAGNLGLNGEQKIFVMFKIDKQGFVKDIQTSAKQSQLEKEATRVVEKLPQMIPGKQKDKNVEVLYSLPIIFNIIN